MTLSVSGTKEYRSFTEATYCDKESFDLCMCDAITSKELEIKLKTCKESALRKTQETSTFESMCICTNSYTILFDNMNN